VVPTLGPVNHTPIGLARSLSSQPTFNILGIWVILGTFSVTPVSQLLCPCEACL
jgi:hypothetical protein